jgi:acyl-CoA synthetase (AMP-forming)/AMP-acid ligase II
MSVSAITTNRDHAGKAPGWLAQTGDIFCKDKDGFFYFRSRVDDMFSCGGENVYPKEVENLLFAHPDVVNAVVRRCRIR